jgi:3-deoxy-D-manno-octulosonic-acid transferase
MEASKAGSGPGASSPGSDAPIILVDTLGELSAAWGLADIAFVGGSFAPRGGQNMIEPAGYGAAIVLGPGTWNFQDTVNHLLACGGAIQLSDSTELVSAVGTLAADASLRTRLGSSARHFVLSQHGATARTVALLVQMLESNAPCSLSVGRPVEQAA